MLLSLLLRLLLSLRFLLLLLDRLRFSRLLLCGLLLLLLRLRNGLLRRLSLLLLDRLFGNLLLLRLILLLRRDCGLVVVFVAAADQRQRCCTDASRPGSTKKGTPRDAKLRNRGQSGNHSRDWYSNAISICATC